MNTQQDTYLILIKAASEGCNIVISSSPISTNLVVALVVSFLPVFLQGNHQEINRNCRWQLSLQFLQTSVHSLTIEASKMENSHQHPKLVLLLFQMIKNHNNRTQSIAKYLIIKSSIKELPRQSENGITNTERTRKKDTNSTSHIQDFDHIYQQVISSSVYQGENRN